MATLLMAWVPGEATIFTNLYNFTATSGYPTYTNSDGANPYAGLVLSSNTLYGTAYEGGIAADGTVFRLNTDGKAFTNLYTFTGSDGRLPYPGLVLSGDTLYGTTAGGGSEMYGTVFSIGTDGASHTNLVNFSYTTAGNGVYAGLVLSGSTLYGVTDGGGSGFNGTVFKVSVDGSSYSNLYNFTFGGGAATNSDGMNPDGRLVLSGGTLYGTTANGGPGGNGTIFRVSTNGTEFTNLYGFTASSSTFPATNSDGRSPRSGLVLSGNTLFGTARYAGSGASGTVFKVNTDGSGFSILHSFAPLVSDPALSTSTNFDGAVPYAGLILSGGALFGATVAGGRGGSGTVFQLNTNGLGFTVLYSFNSTALDSSSFYTNSDGASPYADLVLASNILYGTTQTGGGGGSGTVFALTLTSSEPTPIPLSIHLFGLQAVLTWTDSVFSLQEAPALTGAYSNISGATSPYTNSVAGSQIFFRLKSN